MGYDYRVVNSVHPDVTKAIFETDNKDDVLEWVTKTNPNVRNMSVYLHADGGEFVGLESFIAENVIPAEPLKEKVTTIYYVVYRSARSAPAIFEGSLDEVLVWTESNLRRQSEPLDVFDDKDGNYKAMEKFLREHQRTNKVVPAFDRGKPSVFEGNVDEIKEWIGKNSIFVANYDVWTAEGSWTKLMWFLEDAEKKGDSVNHPAHYTAYKGVEVIDLTEQMNFNRGNAVKYIARAGLKDPSKEKEDLEKALWYIKREIARIEK